MFLECSNLKRMDIQTCVEKNCWLVEVYICFVWGNPKGFCKGQEFAFNPARDSDKSTALPMPEGRHLAPRLKTVYASFSELKGFGMCNAFLRTKLTPKLAVKKKLLFFRCVLDGYSQRIPILEEYWGELVKPCDRVHREW